MNQVIALFHDYTFQVVALGSVLLGILSGTMGTFAVLRKQSLLGDGISHAALPGVVLAFLITGSKNTEILLLGALLTGLLATLLILVIVKHSRIKFDSALAMVMSVFFGLGLVLLTYVQKRPDANQAGLKRFIYGQASTMLQRDVILMCVCGVFVIAIVFLFWKEFKLLTFNAEFAYSLGLPVEKLNLLLSFLVVLTIIIGIQTVGVVLMSAMLIAPAVAARQWSNRLWVMVVLSACFGGISGLAGTAVSSLVSQMPTGPTIVVCITIIALFSLLFAPERGILHKMLKRFWHRQTIKMEGRK